MIKPLLKNQEGMVMVTSLMFMVILFILGTTAYLITSSDLKISGNYKTSKQAFYVAEAGIEHAIAVLKNTEDLTEILQGADGDPEELADNGILSFGSSVGFGSGEYRVVVTDNADEPSGDSNDPTVDTDKKVFITSIGTKDGATSTLVVLFWANHLEVAVDGALAIYGEGPGVQLGVGAGGPAVIDGRDHDVPEDFTCSGANCEGTLNGEPSNTGIYAEDTLNPRDVAETDLAGPPPVSQNVFGSPPVTELSASTGKLAEWLNFAATVVPDTVLDGSQTIAGNTSYGSREDPQVTVINGDVDIHGSGNVDGAGFLIVNGNFNITGTFHWEGVIVVASNSDLSVGATGRVTLLGAVVLAGGGLSAEVDLNGHASINYSSDAINRATESLNNSQIISWENQYN